MMVQVRPAAVAGLFYPAAPDILRQEVKSYLDNAPSSPLHLPLSTFPPAGERANESLRKFHIKALIVPHAGYIYSGAIAASAYATLRNRADEIRRVVMLGPAHRVPVQGLALPDAMQFETPLGRVPLDIEGMQRLRQLPQVSVSAAVHQMEHSLEVQLPFLQNVLGEFELLPLAIGMASIAEVAEVLETEWGGAETLIIISSDLSHYQPYTQARGLDSLTCTAIAELQQTLKYEHACGCIPINGLLQIAQKHHLQPHLLDLRNSGDTAGSKDRVVGYAAFAFTEEENQHADA